MEGGNSNQSDGKSIGERGVDGRGGLNPDTSNTLGRIFDSWSEINKIELDLSDRILISVIMLDYLESDRSVSIEIYTENFSHELRRAWLDRTARIMRDYQFDIEDDYVQKLKGELWLTAVRGGLQSYIDEFAQRQLGAMVELKYFVESRTSWKSQFILGAIVAVFVGVLVGATRIAVTIFD